MRAITFAVATLWTVAVIPRPLAAQRAAPPRALTNVTVIDGTGAGPAAGMTVVIEDGRISDLFRSADRRPPAGAEVIDLTGRFVIPGLVNSHVHFTPLLLRDPDRARAELRRMLYGGVTTVRDAAGSAPLLAELQRAIAAEETPGPDVYFAALVASPDFMRLDPRVGSAAAGAARPPGVTRETDPAQAVARAAESGATGLKFYVGVEADVIRAFIVEADRQGLASWSHATVFPDRPLEVVRAGVDVVSHVCGLPWQDEDLNPAVNVPYTHTPADAPRPVFDPAKVDAESPEMAMLFREMARRGTILDATLSITRAPARPDSASRGCTPQLMARLARAASRAGVPFATGTDYFAPVDDPYPSVFREIEHLVRQDVLTPLEAITAATLHGAKVVGTEATHGTVERGKVANLVVLEADPSGDIGALRRVVLVLKRGVVYRPSDYERRD